VRYEPPLPNVGLLNGLGRIGGSGLGMGIASAAYAAAALWLPFFGRRKKRSLNVESAEIITILTGQESLDKKPTWLQE